MQPPHCQTQQPQHQHGQGGGGYRRTGQYGWCGRWGGNGHILHRRFHQPEPAAHAPDVVIDISRADELKHITMTDDGLQIGALVTHTEIMRSPIIRDLFPALVDAAHTIGAVQTRNLGTLGGNLVTAVPSSRGGARAGRVGTGAGRR